MVDINAPNTGYANLRGLVEDLSAVFDARITEFRKQTPYPNVTPGDVKTFALISRRPRTESELARAQGITRQAAFKSVKRLMTLGLVVAHFEGSNRRDKVLELTAAGQIIRSQGLAFIARIEDEFAAKIGRDRLELFRETLLLILDRAPPHGDAVAPEK